MSSATASPLKPRKTPAQARAHVTVEVIHEAAIQVLLTGGFHRFTTSRIAERAGVSIGTLYQYFPNKRSVLAAVLAAHLDAVVASVEAAVAARHGAPLAAMVDGLVEGFLAAKLRRVEVSLALYLPMEEAGGGALVAAAGQRAAAAIAAMLATCPDPRIAAPMPAAAQLCIAVSALMQAALQAGPGAIDVAMLRRHMRAMALGYLQELARPG